MGLGYIAESLWQHGFSYDVCDMLFKYTQENLVRKINNFHPDLIGISLYTYNYLRTYEFINKLKSYFPDTPFVAGGPHMTTFQDKALVDCQGIDLGVLREGEKAIVELCKGKEISRIEGLMYRDNGEIKMNSERPFNDNLDELPFPKYEKFEMRRYIPEIPIFSSRGCTYRCTYCQVEDIMGRKFRERSVENIMDEIKYWYGKGYKRFNFMDDNFALKRERIYRLCDLLLSEGLTSLFMRCAGIRCDRVDEGLLRRMKQVGFRTLSFGVEAGNNKVLRSLRKGETIETIDKTISIACALGYDVNLFFLLGAPLETREDVYDSFKLALKHPVFRVNFYNIVPFPRTEIYNWVDSKGYFLKEPHEYLNNLTPNDIDPIFKTDEMTVQDKIELLGVARKIERKVLQNAIVRRLDRFKVKGIFVNMLAFVLSRQATEYLIFKNVRVRKIFELARYLYHKSE